MNPNKPFINWIHVFVVAPALVALRYYPAYVIYTPYVAAGIAAYHTMRALSKGGKRRI